MDFLLLGNPFEVVVNEVVVDFLWHVGVPKGFRVTLFGGASAVY